MTRLTRWITRAVIPCQLLFVLGLLAAGAVQDSRYSPARDDISDLGALTAQHPWVVLAPEGLAGVVTIAFALLVLRPALALSGRRTALGAWLLAGSLMGLDNVSDLLFRLDCRRADPGCTAERQEGSWHAQVHELVGLLCALATVAAFIALGRRMRELDAWADLAVPAGVFAVAYLALLLTYAALEGEDGAGYAQRTTVVLLVGAFVVLVRRTRSLQGDGRTSPPLMGAS
jgi:hypothetical membrane protein